jgi:hypothetical protein
MYVLSYFDPNIPKVIPMLFKPRLIYLMYLVNMFDYLPSLIYLPTNLDWTHSLQYLDHTFHLWKDGGAIG